MNLQDQSAKLSEAKKESLKKFIKKLVAQKKSNRAIMRACYKQYNVILIP